jgi:hypothetical protein
MGLVRRPPTLLDGERRSQLREVQHVFEAELG